MGVGVGSGVGVGVGLTELELELLEAEELERANAKGVGVNLGSACAFDDVKVAVSTFLTSNSFDLLNLPYSITSGPPGLSNS